MIIYKNSSELTNMFLTGLEFLGCVFMIHLISITFGASLFANFDRTLFFSFFMAVLCAAPSLILLDHSDMCTLFYRMFVRQEYFDDTEYRFMNIATNAVKGAWFGALVIPLDWDRWWQKWPISCCIGALVGAIFGILTGKRSKHKVKSDN